jgi:hypothetical protein
MAQFPNALPSRGSVSLTRDERGVAGRSAQDLFPSALNCFRYVMTFKISLGFESPGKTILVPGTFPFGSFK